MQEKIIEGNIILFKNNKDEIILYDCNLEKEIKKYPSETIFDKWELDSKPITMVFIVPNKDDVNESYTFDIFNCIKEEYIFEGCKGNKNKKNQYEFLDNKTNKKIIYDSSYCYDIKKYEIVDSKIKRCDSSVKNCDIEIKYFLDGVFVQSLNNPTCFKDIKEVEGLINDQNGIYLFGYLGDKLYIYSYHKGICCIAQIENYESYEEILPINNVVFAKKDGVYQIINISQDDLETEISDYDTLQGVRYLKNSKTFLLKTKSGVCDYSICYPDSVDKWSMESGKSYNVLKEFEFKDLYDISINKVDKHSYFIEFRGKNNIEFGFNIRNVNSLHMLKGEEVLNFDEILELDDKLDEDLSLIIDNYLIDKKRFKKVWLFGPDKYAILEKDNVLFKQYYFLPSENFFDDDLNEAKEINGSFEILPTIIVRKEDGKTYIHDNNFELIKLFDFEADVKYVQELKDYDSQIHVYYINDNLYMHYNNKFLLAPEGIKDDESTSLEYSSLLILGKNKRG